MARKRNNLAGLLLGMAVVTALAGCKGDALPVREVSLLQGERSLPLTVEIAATPASRAKGLMFRKDMPEERGMLFLWPEAGERSFWMKNTLIPLDMLFLKDNTVVAVVAWAKPLDETPITPEQDADAVLETNGGWAGRHGVGVGSLLQVSGSLPQAAR